MIKRIKKKYIFIVMCAVVTVLGVIITAINLMSYSSVNSQVDEKLKMLIQNEGLMPDFPIQEDPEDGEPEDDEGNTPDEDKSENQDDENPDGDGKTDDTGTDKTEEPGGDDTGSGSTGTKNDDLTDGDSASGEEKDKDSDDQTDSEPSSFRKINSPCSVTLTNSAKNVPAVSCAAIIVGRKLTSLSTYLCQPFPR